MRLAAILPGIFISCSLLSCNNKFSYRQIDANDKKYTKYSLETYELYRRAVCGQKVDTSFVSADKKGTKVFAPCDCIPDDTTSNVIEVSYLFLSADHSHILVINNVPDRNQRFFKSADPRFKVNNAVNKTLRVNVYPFSQFRFGLVDADGMAIFRTIDRRPKEHRWKFEQAGDKITVTSVGLQTCYGVDTRYTDSSLFVPPIYRRIPDWQLIHRGRNEKPDKTIGVKKEILLEDRGDWGKRPRIHTHFQLDVDVQRWRVDFDFWNDNNVIKFNNKRMYSFERRKQDPPCTD